MYSVLVRGRIPAADLVAILNAAGVEVGSSVSYAFGAVQVDILAGQKLYFRTGDYHGVTLVAASDGGSQRVDIAAAGGARGGLIVSDLGAGDDLETNIYNQLGALINQRGLSASSP